MLPQQPSVDNIVGRIIHGIVADIVLGAGLLAPFDKVPHSFVTVTTLFMSIGAAAN
jgi:hypothetical protein